MYIDYFFNCFFSYRNNLRNKNKTDIVERVKSDTLISTKLDMVITGTAEVKSEIKNLNNRFDQISERVAICEESIALNMKYNSLQFYLKKV